ncbi:MAG TPA: phosphotransferase, partial [Thermoanaerobaculia bacterium]|nr:phosphotransferase [Thermoanaerobaculia bacterium]
MLQPQPPWDCRALASFAGRRLGRHAEALEISLRPLRGGLESAAVARVEVRFEDGPGRRTLFAFVAKRLDGRTVREAAIYRDLVAREAADFAPALLGAERLGPPHAAAAGSWHLYLEAVRPVSRWPWRDERAAGQVLARLARLHAAADPGAAAAALAGWNYEAELALTAAAAVADLEAVPREPELAPLRRALPALRRVVFALPAARRQLLAAPPPLGSAVLHGDVHPGNALVRRRGAAERPVLIDWGR